MVLVIHTLIHDTGEANKIYQYYKDEVIFSLVLGGSCYSITTRMSGNLS